MKWTFLIELYLFIHWKIFGNRLDAILLWENLLLRCCYHLYVRGYLFALVCLYRIMQEIKFL